MKLEDIKFYGISIMVFVGFVVLWYNYWVSELNKMWFLLWIITFVILAVLPIENTKIEAIG